MTFLRVKLRRDLGT